MSTQAPPPLPNPTPAPALAPPAPSGSSGPVSEKANIDVHQLSRDHTSAVQQIKDMKVLVTSFLDTILVRRNDEPEKETQRIKLTIQQVLAIQNKLDQLGKEYANLRLNTVCSLPCGNTGYVILDPTEEKTGFHKQLIQCYTWLKNLDADCTRALEMLKLNSESEMIHGSDQTIWKKSEKSLQTLVQEVQTSFPTLTFNTYHLVAESCLEVKVEKVFAVRVFFSGTTISHVNVVSVNEQMTTNIWETSKHIVFQKLSDIFTSVVLRLTHKEAGAMLRAFVLYVSEYTDLFENKCESCKRRLYAGTNGGQFLPPLWKEMNSKLFYHLSCR